MCGSYDDACDNFYYSVRENLKYVCIYFTIFAVVGTVTVLIAAYGFLLGASITVKDASLTRFALVSSQPTELAYNLSLALYVHNRNWAMTMTNTKKMDATYSFDGQQFERVSLGGVGDKHRAGANVLHRLVTNSEGTAVSLGNAGVVAYKEQSKKGVFMVDVVVTGEVRYTARYTKCKLEATCSLALQLAPPGTAAVTFETVKCNLAPREKNC